MLADPGRETSGISTVGGHVDLGADVDGDGQVGFDDVLQRLGSWGPCA